MMDMALEAFLAARLNPISTRVEVLDERQQNLSREHSWLESRQTEQGQRIAAMAAHLRRMQADEATRRAAKDERKKMRSEAIALVNWAVSLVLILSWAFGLIEGEKVKAILSALARVGS
jgi:hypothetical protein